MLLNIFLNEVILGLFVPRFESIRVKKGKGGGVLDFPPFVFVETTSLPVHVFKQGLSVRLIPWMRYVNTKDSLVVAFAR